VRHYLVLLLQIEIVTGQLLQVGVLLLLLLLLLQHVPLAEVGLQIGLHLIETNAAPAEEIGRGGVLPISVVHRQMGAGLAGGGVAYQHGSRQMAISLLIMMLQLLLLLLLRLTYEKYYNSRDGSRRRAYVIARSTVFKGVIVQKRGEWNAYQHRN